MEHTINAHTIKAEKKREEERKKKRKKEKETNMTCNIGTVYLITGMICLTVCKRNIWETQHSLL